MPTVVVPLFPPKLRHHTELPLRPSGSAATAAVEALSDAALHKTALAHAEMATHFPNNPSAPRRALFVVGLGNTGKSVFLRWACERALDRRADLALFSLGPNPDLQNHFPDTQLLFGGAHMGAHIDWLLTDPIAAQAHAAFDIGSGDPALADLATGQHTDTSTLATTLLDAGIEPILIVMLSPRETDLTPLDALDATGFQPACTALVLNEGRATVDRRDFDAVRSHSVYRNACKRNAAEIWMPRNFAQPAVDAARGPDGRPLSYAKAQETDALLPMQRGQLARWLFLMDATFAPIGTWLP